MRGKNKCKILKQIRQKIADENDIPFVTSECGFQGECKGTCPKCEAELRYLEEQLAKRQKLGKTITVAALAASLMTGLTACPAPTETENTKITDTLSSQTEQTDESSEITWMGTAPIEESSQGEPTESSEFVIGEMPDGIGSLIPTEDAESYRTLGYVNPEAESETEEPFELEGDVAYIEPEEIESDLVKGMIAIDETDSNE